MTKNKKIVRVLSLILIVILVIIVLAVMLLIIADRYISHTTAGRIYSELDSIPANRVGLILGTSSQYQGKVNEYFLYRCQAGADLFHHQKVEFLLVSGDNSSIFYNEPRDFQKCLIELGVPEEKIYLDYAGFRTIDSVIRAKEVFGLSEFTVISQKFHLERAIFTADKYDLNAIGYQAQDVSSPKNHLRVRLREVFARGNLFIDLVTRKQPKFLGEPIEIQ